MQALSTVEGWQSAMAADQSLELLFPSRYARGWLDREGFAVASTSFAFFFPRLLGWFRPLEARLRWLPLGGQYGVFARPRLAG